MDAQIRLTGLACFRSLLSVLIKCFYLIKLNNYCCRRLQSIPATKYDIDKVWNMIYKDLAMEK